ncbi:hypothetical protein BRY73_23940 [Ochrobactrum sp. P6BS-III]|uniref:helix-turn-helix domain-containing protein n=1 Tax=unclassified Ochrobactrum TaxID=239106 RepID=UPI000993E6A0|nr:transcriptional regulator with XRE-family HTH domain [Ochrobactrum sp. P6BSIII]OOL14277.1 hypothetical protein BRY73_23940 [Ochrobactrum sp. P6BS-III]
MSLSDDIKNARKSAGKTQQDVADYLRVSVQAVSQWENGRTLPSSGNLMQLSKFINLQIQDKVDLHSVLVNARDTSGMALAPLVKWNDHADWHLYNFDLFSEENTKGLIPEHLFGVHWKPKGEIYALKVIDYSMRPDIASGDIVIIDTGRAPERGDFVVIKMENFPVVRLGVYEPMGFNEHRAPIFSLKRLSADAGNPIIVDNNNPGFVVGVVRETRRFYRTD